MPAVASVRDPSAPPAALSPAAAIELSRARHLWREGDLTGALAAYRAITVRPGAAPVAILERGEVELASGDAAAAEKDGTSLFQPSDPALRARARFLVASADLSLGRYEQVPRLVDANTAPDGLGDFAVFLRAQAAAKANQPDVALRELERAELRDSTNRVLLEQAGQLAASLNAPGLAAELEAHAGTFQGWTADRTRVIQAAARDAARAGQTATEIAQDRFLIENFGWTAAAVQATTDLQNLGALDAYDRGLAAMSAGQFPAARAAFQEAESGPDAAAAKRKLAALDDALAWAAATKEDTVEAYRAFAATYPASPHAGDALFAAGLLDYQAGQYADALAAWSIAPGCPSEGAIAPTPMANCANEGDGLARRLFWSGKALLKLSRADEARADWRKAAETRPTGYYALRARDVLAGATGWPTTHSTETPGATSTTDAEAWLTRWAGSPTAPTAGEATRVQRGLGLLVLGDFDAATAELNGVIADTHNPWLLLRVADVLATDELWAPSSRAANRLVSLSPDPSVLDAPPSIQRLAYPPAYLDLVQAQARQQGIDPLLFLSLMYQESGDDPLALSLAGARGLTQVMPATGRGVATAVGLKDFSPDALDRPSVAIQLGTWYFANELRSEGGDPFRALAAYNAGERPLARWAASDPDLFVERIDYAETKQYVQKIYVHDEVYRFLAP